MNEGIYLLKEFFAEWARTRPRGRFIPALLAAAAGAVCGAMLWDAGQDRSGQVLPFYLDTSSAALAREDDVVAEIAVRRVMAVDPTDANARYQLAMLSERLGDLNRAVAIMADLAESGGPRSEDANCWLIDHLLERSVPLTPDERGSLVRRLERRVLERPRHAEARLLLAQFYLDAGIRSRAIEQLERAIDQRPESKLKLAEQYFLAGERAKGLEMARQAANYFEMELAAQPCELDVRLQLAAAFALAEEFPTAIGVVRDGLLLGEAPTLHQRIATLLVAWAVHRGKSDAAHRIPLDPVEQALQHDPNHLGALALLLHLAKEASASGEAAREALNRRLAAGEAPALVHLSLGTAAALDGDVETARRELDRARTINPQSPATLNNLAWLIAHEPEPDLAQALQLSEEAVRLAPRDARLRETRGRILVLMERWSDAVPDLEVAAAEFSRHDDLRHKVPEIHAALARAYEALGETSRSAAHAELSREVTR